MQRALRRDCILEIDYTQERHYGDDTVCRKYMFPRVKNYTTNRFISNDLNQSNKKNDVPSVTAEVLGIMGHLFVLHYFSPTYLRPAYCNRLND